MSHQEYWLISDWRDNLEVKSFVLLQRTQVRSPAPTYGSQPLITPVPGDLIPFLFPWLSGSHMVHRRTYTDTSNNKNLKFFFKKFSCVFFAGMYVKCTMCLPADPLELEMSVPNPGLLQEQQVLFQPHKKQFLKRLLSYFVLLFIYLAAFWLYDNLVDFLRTFI